MCMIQDTVIYERLVGHQPFKDATTQHLQDFAALGLIHFVSDVVTDECLRYIGWSLAVKNAALNRSDIMKQMYLFIYLCVRLSP